MILHRLLRLDVRLGESRRRRAKDLHALLVRQERLVLGARGRRAKYELRKQPPVGGEVVLADDVVDDVGCQSFKRRSRGAFCQYGAVANAPPSNAQKWKSHAHATSDSPSKCWRLAP